MNPVVMAWRAGLTPREAEKLTQEELQRRIEARERKKAARIKAQHEEAVVNDLAFNLDCSRPEYVERMARWVGLDYQRATNLDIARAAMAKRVK